MAHGPTDRQARLVFPCGRKPFSVMDATLHPRAPILYSGHWPRELARRIKVDLPFHCPNGERSRALTHMFIHSHHG
jgi:hypothetical protein